MTAAISEILARMEPRSTSTFTEDVAPRAPMAAVAKLEDIAPESPRPDYRTWFLSYHRKLVDGMPTMFHADVVPYIHQLYCDARAFNNLNDGLIADVGERHTRNMIRHCDFRSVSLPGYTLALESVRATQSEWLVALGLIAAAADTDDDYDDDLIYDEPEIAPVAQNPVVLH